MSTSDETSKPPLSELVPEVDSFLARDRLTQIKDRAAQFIAEVAGEYITQDAAARLPDMEDRWSAWESGIVSPLLQAAPADMTLYHDRYRSSFDINLTVPFPNHGVTSQLPIELSLRPAGGVAKTAAVDEFYLFSNVRELQRKHEGVQHLMHPSENTRVYARQAGVPILTTVRGTTKWLRRPIEVPYVDLGELVDAATSKRRTALGNVAVDKVVFALGKKPNTSEDTRVQGEVAKPGTTFKTPYLAYGHIYSTEVRAVVDALRPEDLELAAWGKLDSGEIYDHFEDNAAEAVTEFERKLKVADEVFRVVTQSDHFKRLVAA